MYWAVYLALGTTPDGRKHIVGLWIDPDEGAKFWLRIVNELRNRGVKDILIAVVDGLKGFREAINAAFPQPQTLPYRRGGYQAAVFSLAPGEQRLEECPTRMDRRHDPVAIMFGNRFSVE